MTLAPLILLAAASCAAQVPVPTVMACATNHMTTLIRNAIPTTWRSQKC